MSIHSPWLRGTLGVAMILVIHEALLRGLRIDGVRPDLLVGIGIVAAVVAGPERGAVLAFAAGLAGDLFVDTPFGLSALVACVVAFVAGTVAAALGPNPRWALVAITAVASAVAEVLWALVGTVLGLPGLLHPRLVVIAVVVAAVNAAVSLPAGVLMRWVFAGAKAAPARGFVG